MACVPAPLKSHSTPAVLTAVLPLPLPVDPPAPLVGGVVPEGAVAVPPDDPPPPHAVRTAMTAPSSVIRPIPESALGRDGPMDVF